MPVGSWNTTSTSVASSIDSSGLLMLLLAIAAIVTGLIIFTSIDRYSKFFKALEWVLETIKYALYGAVVIASLGVLYVVCTMLTSVGGAVGFKPEWILYAIGAYGVLAGLGWVAEFVAKHAANMHARYVEQQAAVEEPSA